MKEAFGRRVQTETKEDTQLMNFINSPNKINQSADFLNSSFVE
jgi:hypothetical protein